MKEGSRRIGEEEKEHGKFTRDEGDHLK